MLVMIGHYSKFRQEVTPTLRTLKVKSRLSRADASAAPKRRVCNVRRSRASDAERGEAQHEEPSNHMKAAITPSNGNAEQRCCRQEKGRPT